MIRVSVSKAHHQAVENTMTCSCVGDGGASVFAASPDGWLASSSEPDRREWVGKILIRAIGTLCSIRRLATKARRDTTTTKRRNQRFDSRITTQPTHRQCAQKVNNVGCSEPKRFAISTHPSLDTTIDTNVLPSGLVESLFRKDSALLDLETNH